MKKVCLTLYAALLSVLAFAQEGGGGDGAKLDVNVNTTESGGDWDSAPWVWIVGAAVFILLLVALTRGSGNRRSVD